MGFLHPVSALTIIGALMLLVAAAHDAAVRTVPNSAALILFICGLLIRLLVGDMQWSVIASFAVFAATFLFWRFGLMGGGDLKLLTAGAMFVGSAKAVPFLLVTVIAGGVLSLLYLLGGVLVPRPRKSRPIAFLARVWRTELWRLHRRGPLPYAVAIAFGGLYVSFAPIAQ